MEALASSACWARLFASSSLSLRPCASFALSHSTLAFGAVSFPLLIQSAEAWLPDHHTGIFRQRLSSCFVKGCWRASVQSVQQGLTWRPPLAAIRMALPETHVFKSQPSVSWRKAAQIGTGSTRQRLCEPHSRQPDIQTCQSTHIYRFGQAGNAEHVPRQAG